MSFEDFRKEVVSAAKEAPGMYFAPLKLVPAFIVSWILWILGDLAYCVLELNDDSEKWCSFWYTVYNSLMLASDDVQEWAGGKRPWFPWGELP